MTKMHREDAGGDVLPCRLDKAPTGGRNASRIEVEGPQNQVCLTGIASPGDEWDGLGLLLEELNLTLHCSIGAKGYRGGQRHREGEQKQSARAFTPAGFRQDPYHPHNAEPSGVMILSARPIRVGSWLAKQTVIGSGWARSKLVHVLDHALSRDAVGSSASRSDEG